MTRAAIALIGCAIAACGSSSKRTLPSNHAAGELSAERAFLDSIAPDYSPPAERHAFATRKRAGDLYARDCRGGIPEACWWAKALLGDADFDARIEANCEGGHVMSCRAVRLQSGLTQAELHDGCAAGIDVECVELARTTDSTSESRFAWERSCMITRATCRSAAEEFLETEPRDPVKARDLLELGCPFERADCVPLAAAYLRKELVEPRAGRGRLLYDYACATAGRGCEKGTNTPLVRTKIDI